MSIKRAVVLIGVQHVSGMRKLKAVWNSVYRMKDWALSQGIPQDDIKVITDEDKDKREDGQQREDNDVTVGYVRSVIKKFATSTDLHQLLIYFSGHGMNISGNEYWLLSGSVDDGTEAVNLEGSMEAAERGLLPHVVFISDACRSPAETIAQQNILSATMIYPSKHYPGLGKDVDVFYATSLGTPAMEIQDPDEAESYSAIYSDVLLDSLSGLHPRVLEPSEEDQDKRLIRPRPLKKFLTKHVPIRVTELLGIHKTQVPDARVTSDDDVWLSKVTATPGAPGGSFESTDHLAPELVAHIEATEFFNDLPSATLRETINGNFNALEAIALSLPSMKEKLHGDVMGQLAVSADQFTQQVRVNSTGFEPAQFETGSGFRIRGANVENVVTSAEFEVQENGDLIRITFDGPAASVLLVLNNGSGVLIPAIDRFIATLTFDQEGLADVAYEPTPKSDRWYAFSDRAEEIRQLRGVVAAASRQGTFRLEGEDSEIMARRMQLAKGLDPTLALYAAHAYRDQGRRGRSRLKEMSGYMRNDLGFCPFDIALLAGKLGKDGEQDFNERALPFLPMLSQTWALLPVYDIQFSDPLKHIIRHLQPDSLWTLYEKDGVDLISSAIQQGLIR